MVGCSMILLVLDLEHIQEYKRHTSSSRDKASRRNGRSRKQQLRSILSNSNRLLRAFRERSDCEIVQVLSSSSTPEGGLPAECLESLGWSSSSSSSHRHRLPSYLSSHSSTATATTTASVVGTTGTETILRNPSVIGGFPVQKLRTFLRNSTAEVWVVMGHMADTEPQTLARILAVVPRHRNKRAVIVVVSDACSSSSSVQLLVDAVPQGATVRDTASIVHELRRKSNHPRIAGAKDGSRSIPDSSRPPRPCVPNKKKRSFRPPGGIYQPQQDIASVPKPHDPSAPQQQQQRRTAAEVATQQQQQSPTSVLHPPQMLSEKNNKNSAATVAACWEDASLGLLHSSPQPPPRQTTLCPRRLEQDFWSTGTPSAGRCGPERTAVEMIQNCISSSATEQLNMGTVHETEESATVEKRQVQLCDESGLSWKRSTTENDLPNANNHADSRSDGNDDDGCDALDILDTADNVVVGHCPAVRHIEPCTWELCHWVQSIQHWTTVLSNSSSNAGDWTRCDASSGMILRSALFASMQEMVRANQALQTLLASGGGLLLLDTKRRSNAVRHPTTSMLAIGLPALLCGAQ